MKVIFAGGGTGGHLYPAISIAEKLSNKNIEFHFMVSDRGIEANILNKLGYTYTEQKVSAFMGQKITGKIKALFNMVKATFKAFSIINKGDKIILTGGFASAPSAIAGKILGCEIYLHEQNSVMGLVNRSFAGICNKVFLSFKDTKNAKGNIVVTGNPVRDIFYKIGSKDDYSGSLLILGGSQGSRKINNIIIESIDLIIDMGFNVFHQTGEKLYDECKNKYGSKLDKYKDKLDVQAYIDDIAWKMRDSDIIVSRSGAGAVFEIRALNCPALYIPFAQASENHQYYNALEVEKFGGCVILEEKDADKEAFMNKLKDLKENINTYRSNLKSNQLPVSSDIILREAGLE